MDVGLGASVGGSGGHVSSAEGVDGRNGGPAARSGRHDRSEEDPAAEAMAFMASRVDVTDRIEEGRGEVGGGGSRLPSLVWWDQACAQSKRQEEQSGWTSAVNWQRWRCQRKQRYSSRDCARRTVDLESNGNEGVRGELSGPAPSVGSEPIITGLPAADFDDAGSDGRRRSRDCGRALAIDSLWLLLLLPVNLPRNEAAL
ncbi:hypothetical protein BCR44DRAFT_1487032 [Catenaria anguillulae PL171]|uniref:Uncharacterized protein n=1 Tax=Catenaria anguillulae PL171 TaxID=765915 RepID=A0A1Y2HHW5_9FUNG|nr:hypothetical protein BCR44DRAFT_1487032 [Catenaria anguillulae PL171]